MRRFYQLLDISEDATEDQIKQAYRRMASKYHPDKNAGREKEAAEEFKEVKEAYECLSDPERKQIYDETGDSSVETGDPVQDLFIHILNELLSELETVAEVLAKCRSVIGEMIGEVQERKIQADKKIIAMEKMIKAQKYKGKTINLLEGVMKDKLTELKSDRSELDIAGNAAQAVMTMLNDYQALDRAPPPRPQTNVEIQTQMLNSLFERTVMGGKRRGGFPFSGV